jgi:hypothetical protein
MMIKAEALEKGFTQKLSLKRVNLIKGVTISCYRLVTQIFSIPNEYPYQLGLNVKDISNTLPIL